MSECWPALDDSGGVALAEEAPVALVFDGGTLAVMMATPDALEDFAVGFALSEEVIAAPEEIRDMEIQRGAQGIEVRLWLAHDRADALARRRRTLAGPVGCGLCGIDSLAQAVRDLPRLPMSDGPVLSWAQVGEALEVLRGAQSLHDATRATHAAGFVAPGEGLTMLREDVGRHNALDKLIGAMARTEASMAQGAVVLTSRVSTEMVQKCVLGRAPVLIAASAPTAHGVRLAEGAGLTLVARGPEGPRIFTHPARIGDQP